MHVSVVIPVFNAGKTLLRAINSAVECNAESVIVVDNGSSDDSLEIARSVGGNVKVFSSPERGANRARNYGLSLVRTRLVQFLDADDELVVGKFERQTKMFQRSGSLTFVAGAYKEVGCDGKCRLVVPRIGDCWASLIEGKLGITSSNLFDSEAVRSVGGWREDLASSQEYDLMFRLMKLRVMPAVDTETSAVVYRQPASISSERTVEKWKRFASVRTGVEGFLSASCELTDERKTCLKTTYLRICRRIYDIDSSSGFEMHANCLGQERWMPKGFGLYGPAYWAGGFMFAQRLSELWSRFKSRSK